jgi:hypothetical protein
LQGEGVSSARVDEALLNELRILGATAASPPGIQERDTVAERVRALLVDPEDPDLRYEFVLWAERMASRGPTAEMRSAARLLLSLLRDGTAPSAIHTVDPPVRLGISPRAALIVAALVAGLTAGGVMAARVVSTPTLEVSGPASGAAFGRLRVGRLVFSAHGSPSLLRRERWSLDGRDVTRFVQLRNGAAIYRPGRLDEGGHAVDVRAGGGFFGASAHKRIDFAVDLTPPFLEVPGPFRAVAWHRLDVKGKTDQNARVTVAGRTATVEDGKFSISLPAPQPRVISVVATDPAGNATISQQPITVIPRRPPAPIRGVHVTADAWGNPALRRGVLALIAAHRINTVEIDLKDEGGIAGWNPPVPLARTIGAAQPIYDLAATVRRLHGLGVRVIGRIVCFRDPILAAAAWRDGRHNEVVQTPSGKEYAGYGGFTNVADPVVRAYNIAIAVAAARVGVDDVLYDYVRRPDGPLASMHFPGLQGTAADAIVAFLRQTRLALRPYHTFLGASVFGVAATRPEEVAQDVPQMARQVDYIAPLVYPSHWGAGEYNVANPNAQPYQIVQRSLTDFERDVVGTPARLVPWVQDFSLGVTYGPYQVRAEIAAARRDGIDEFLLWDPAVTYTASALDRTAP